ncbi:MAG: sugar transferase, partial [Alphaproteobacteria bacterium]
MKLSKRIFDLVVALILSVVLAPVIAAVALVILVRDGRPVFFGHTRVRAPGETFTLWKFRTMLPLRRKRDHGVSGGHKRRRITRTGRFL